MKSTEQYLAEILKHISKLRNGDEIPMDTMTFDAHLTEMFNSIDAAMFEMKESCSTTPSYFECECDENYIHLADTTCPKCGKEQSDCADARIRDVVDNFLSDDYLTK